MRPSGSARPPATRGPGRGREGGRCRKPRDITRNRTKGKGLWAASEDEKTKKKFAGREGTKVQRTLTRCCVQVLIIIVSTPTAFYKVRGESPPNPNPNVRRRHLLATIKKSGIRMNLPVKERMREQEKVVSARRSAKRTRTSARTRASPNTSATPRAQTIRSQALARGGAS